MGAIRIECQKEHAVRVQRKRLKALEIEVLMFIKLQLNTLRGLDSPRETQPGKKVRDGIDINGLRLLTEETHHHRNIGGVPLPGCG